MNVEGKVVVVTGGASGLGAATVRKLAAQGARVVVADIREPEGTAVAAEVGGRYVRCDVTSEEEAKAVVAQAQALGELRGLVNCAGVATGERVVGREGPSGLAKFSRTIAINLIGTYNLLNQCAAVMSTLAPNAEGERGVIVNTASVAAFDGQIGQAAYSASKAGVVGMTLPIARELARFGIRVMTIAPGIFETPMMAGLPAEVQASLATQVPFPPRLGRPEEFAALVAHIFDNVMLNGETIRLDGAIRMAPK
ncbi:MAG: SDR family NAD(P)-dependent oxidoreductase [Casimicrobiaceae bacterium]|nr:SDR family NAD(P)-dependent oxidoreductase [Casimicrobiaceae bacterium]MCX8099442.1 SDR family NAD(P)-dependent oxidoreductase [Casimicrobiaceae bacterium]MDW8313109.1 SDR family NAD(P)-dependent oxidoreductase [Burkholderiales bacterium]